MPDADDKSKENKADEKKGVSKTLIDPTSDNYHINNPDVEYSTYTHFLILLFSITLFLRIAFHMTDFILRVADAERA